MDENKVQQETVTVKQENEVRTLRTIKEVIEDTMKLLDGKVLDRLKKLEGFTNDQIDSVVERFVESRIEKHFDDFADEKIDEMVGKAIDDKVGDVDVEDMVSDAIRDANIDDLVKNEISENDLATESRVDEMIEEYLSANHYMDRREIIDLIDEKIASSYSDDHVLTDKDKERIRKLIGEEWDKRLADAIKATVNTVDEVTILRLNDLERKVDAYEKVFKSLGDIFNTLVKLNVEKKGA